MKYLENMTIDEGYGKPTKTEEQAINFNELSDRDGIKIMQKFGDISRDALVLAQGAHQMYVAVSLGRVRAHVELCCRDLLTSLFFCVCARPLARARQVHLHTDQAKWQDREPMQRAWC